MDIELSPDLILSHKTVKKIIKKKTEHLGSDVDLNQKPIVKFINSPNGIRGKYATIEFIINHPTIQDLTQTLRVFVKIRLMKNVNNQFSIVKALGLFYREVEVYTSVFPKLLKPEDEDIVPKFLHAEEDLVLILEDMKYKNYITANKMQVLDFPHCNVALNSLARFHARAIVYQELETAYPLLGISKRYSVSEKLQISNPESYLRIYFTAIGHSLAEAFRFIPELQTLEHKKFKLEFRQMVEKFFDTIAHQDFSKLRVLCHSDLVASNLMFRYNDNNEPVSCCFVDFQFTKYSSPAYELWSFLYMNTSQEMRNEKIVDFCKIYYEALSKILNENEVYASYIFPYSEFMNMIKKDRIYGLIQGILNLYQEFRQDLKSIYGKDYGEILHEFWKNSPDLPSEFVEPYQEYKQRIIEEIIELYSMMMTPISSR